MDKTEKEKKCPLKPSGWIQCLIADQNQAKYKYSSEAVSTLTKVIIQLTMIMVIIGFLALSFNTFGFITFEIKMVCFFVVGGLILYVINWKLIKYLNGLSDLKREMQKIIDVEDEIIEDIIDGELTDTNEIRKRYKEI